MQEIKHREVYHLLTNYEPRVDENGQKYCVNCDKPIPKSRRKYCSAECANEFFAKHNWVVMRARILRKQNYTCQECGATPPRNKEGFMDWPMDGSKNDCYAYVVDHIVPIALGGEEFDESNLQALCGICNREKTKVDQAKIAELRHRIKRDMEFRGYDLSKFLPDAVKPH